MRSSVPLPAAACSLQGGFPAAWTPYLSGENGEAIHPQQPPTQGPQLLVDLPKADTPLGSLLLPKPHGGARQGGV